MKVNLARFNYYKIFLISGIILIIYTFLPYVFQELSYRLLQWRRQEYVLKDSTVSGSNSHNLSTSGLSVFGQIMSKRSIQIAPVNTDFSIVIEKIGLSVPVVMGVSVTNENTYKEALKNGVAHAITSDLPSEEAGNVYLFAHSSFNFWTLGKYATAFNLIGKLKQNDEINVFYHGKRYIYSVVNRETYPGWNTYPLTRSVIEPILTLQTCDPPGTTLNRLVVTAKLKTVL